MWISTTFGHDIVVFTTSNIQNFLCSGGSFESTPGTKSECRKSEKNPENVTWLTSSSIYRKVRFSKLTNKKCFIIWASSIVKMVPNHKSQLRAVNLLHRPILCCKRVHSKCCILLIYIPQDSVTRTSCEVSILVILYNTRS